MDRVENGYIIFRDQLTMRPMSASNGSRCVMSVGPTKSLYTLQDPTKQYPQPKFKRQTQTAPGSDKKMTPRTDHGETSYRRCGRLPNRKTLITCAAAIAFAREGADVAISYLPSEEEDAKEMAPLFVLLASQESSYVTGEGYGATGGLEVS
jgi:hypothetical protein